MLRSFVFALFAAVAALFVSATPSFAQTTIAVVDMQQILNDSDAGKSIVSQISKVRDSVQAEIKKMEGELKSAEQDLVKKKGSMKPEEFATARKAFEKKVMDSRGKVQNDRAALDKGFNGAINELRKALIEVVSAVASEKKIQLVITKQNVVIGDNSLDLTAEVMTKLNEKIKTVKVSVDR